jgi:hypothetical protein
MIPKGHLLRRIDVFVTAVLGELHEQLGPFYSDIGRPSIDPELLIRMHLVGYCFGIRSERELCEEVMLYLAYRWFCRLDLDDKVRRIGGKRRQVSSMISAMKSDVTACALRSRSLSSPGSRCSERRVMVLSHQRCGRDRQRAYKVAKTSFESEVERGPEK